jgi:hypothetical protein
MMTLLVLPIICLQMMLIMIILSHPPILQHHQQSFNNSSFGPVTPILKISPIHLSISEIVGRLKIKYDHNDLEDVMSYNEILDYVEREHNNKDGHHWNFWTILGHIHTPVGHKDRMGSDYSVKMG